MSSFQPVNDTPKPRHKKVVYKKPEVVPKKTKEERKAERMALQVIDFKTLTLLREYRCKSN